MIYIHGKWQPEQESEDVILSQTGNKASESNFHPIHGVSSHFPSIARGAEQPYHSRLPRRKQQHAGKNAVEIYRDPREICGK